ncbi:hypothetical protein [Dyadobacter psychrotolerans]|uniref:Uncharacterized protein n=1 Tax=Dyadobacter psychrotolerans TaxID=2541721 RepID=A0A4R5DAY7_9BACT|nr:hypothetical protein [Dyadobacter psychrotolerans]TDE10027.1 hypothetical protein E0F88_29320 [Dyadobacter psychrotolerans]
MQKLIFSILALILWNCNSKSEKQIETKSLNTSVLTKSLFNQIGADINSSVDVENMNINEVKNLLKLMVKTDQQYRDSLEIGDKKHEAFYLQKLKANDEANLKLLDKIIQYHGWPGLSKFGEEGATTAWLVIWHHRDKRHILCRYYNLMEEAVRNKEMHPGALKTIDKGLALLSPDQIEY